MSAFTDAKGPNGLFRKEWSC